MTGSPAACRSDACLTVLPVNCKKLRKFLTTFGSEEPGYTTMAIEHATDLQASQDRRYRSTVEALGPDIARFGGGYEHDAAKRQWNDSDMAP